ncbi:hypothetical protein EV424DRAFT_1535014 [Suillus variegatus]|nr:hypothetical protein EV424DRAFT_1535014 [Suillus variegatus]
MSHAFTRTSVALSDEDVVLDIADHDPEEELTLSQKFLEQYKSAKVLFKKLTKRLDDVQVIQESSTLKLQLVLQLKTRVSNTVPEVVNFRISVSVFTPFSPLIARPTSNPSPSRCSQRQGSILA